MSTDLQVKLSVIITVYNGGNTIDRALESLLKCPCKLEIILVNDKSTDDTHVKVCKFKGKFNQQEFKYINSEKKLGPGRARNIALDHVTGNFVTFLDADDRIVNSSLKKILDTIKSFKANIYVGDHRYIESWNKKYSSKNLLAKKVGFLEADDKGVLLSNNLYSWAKLYDSDFINNKGIRFSEDIIYEDMKFVLSAVDAAEKIYLCNSIFVDCYVSASSAMRSNFNSGFHIDSFTIALKELLMCEFSFSFKSRKLIINELIDRARRYSIKDKIENRIKNFNQFMEIIKEISLRWIGNCDDCFLENDFAADLISVPVINQKLEKKIWMQFSGKHVYMSKNTSVKGVVFPPKSEKKKQKLKNILIQIAKRNDYIKHKLLSINNYEIEYHKVKYYETLDEPRDVSIFMGFDFEYRGNSKYLFLEKIKEKNAPIYFVTKDKRVPEFFRIEPLSDKFYYLLSKAKEIYFESHVDNSFYYSKDCEHIQLWHGIPIKKLGLDSPAIYENGGSLESYQRFANYDKICVANKANMSSLESAFTIENSKFEYVIPARVQWLMNNKNLLYKNYLKNKLNIPYDAKVILYAPTWRDKWLKIDDYSMLLDFDNLNFPENVRVVFLQHSYINISIRKNKNIIIPDGSFEVQELILISDICISDYSSIIYDFLEMKKSIFLYWNDYQEYNYYRGIYSTAKETLQIYAYNNQVNLMKAVIKKL